MVHVKKGNRFFLVFKKDQVIGCFGINDMTGYIHDIVVLPKYRGKGYGTFIFNIAKHLLIKEYETKPEQIYSYVDKDQTRWYDTLRNKYRIEFIQPDNPFSRLSFVVEDRGDSEKQYIDINQNLPSTGEESYFFVGHHILVHRPTSQDGKILISYIILMYGKNETTKNRIVSQLSGVVG